MTDAATTPASPTVTRNSIASTRHQATSARTGSIRARTRQPIGAPSATAADTLNMAVVATRNGRLTTIHGTGMTPIHARTTGRVDRAQTALTASAIGGAVHVAQQAAANVR